MTAGGIRPGAGRKPGKGGKKAAKAAASERLFKLSKKLLFEQIGGVPRTVKIMKEILDNPAPSAKDREGQQRLLTKLMEYFGGRPTETVQVSGEVRQNNVLILPDKETRDEWMARHNQITVEDKDKKAKPN